MKALTIILYNHIMQIFHLGLSVYKVTSIQMPFQDLKEHKSIVFFKMLQLKSIIQYQHYQML